jgi:hypothetical protein
MRRDPDMLGTVVGAVDGFLERREADFKRGDRDAHQPDEGVAICRACPSIGGET